MFSLAVCFSQPLLGYRALLCEVGHGTKCEKIHWQKKYASVLMRDAPAIFFPFISLVFPWSSYLHCFHVGHYVTVCDVSSPVYHPDRELTALRWQAPLSEWRKQSCCISVSVIHFVWVRNSFQKQLLSAVWLLMTTGPLHMPCPVFCPCFKVHMSMHMYEICDCPCWPNKKLRERFARWHTMSAATMALLPIWHIGNLPSGPLIILAYELNGIKP